MQISHTLNQCSLLTNPLFNLELETFKVNRTPIPEVWELSLFINLMFKFFFILCFLFLYIVIYIHVDVTGTFFNKEFILIWLFLYCFGILTLKNPNKWMLQMPCDYIGTSSVKKHSGLSRTIINRLIYVIYYPIIS